MPVKKRMPTIESVMTPCPLAIDAAASLRQARGMMVEHGVRHLPVERQGRLIGILSDRDIKRSLDPALGLPPGNQLFVRDICVFDVYTVRPDEPLDQVLLTMAARHIGSVLVAEAGTVRGIFTSTDACRCFGEHLRSAAGDSGGGSEKPARRGRRDAATPAAGRKPRARRR